MGAGLVTYTDKGVEFDTRTATLRLSLIPPRTITVKAIDELTGQEKTYLLRVSSRGLCLV